jgi:lipopolysaccharide/colanic/teichoic acid biosynthesis glycosyltransferase
MRVLHWQPIPASALLMKRVIDVIASAIGLLFLSPLLALIALIIAVDSPGPVLYRSCRIGKKGRTFTCYKFRTMVENAEVLQSTLVQHNERKGVLLRSHVIHASQ